MHTRSIEQRNRTDCKWWAAAIGDSGDLGRDGKLVGFLVEKAERTDKLVGLL
jgi:hypothetical protein